MLILKKGHQPGVYVPLRALFLVFTRVIQKVLIMTSLNKNYFSMTSFNDLHMFFRI